LKKSQVDDERDKLAAAQATNAALQSKISALSDVAQRQTQVEALAQQTQALLVTDVSWSSVLQALSRTIPSDVWLTSFQGSVNGTGTSTGTAAPGTTPAAPATGTSGSVIGVTNFAAVGTSFDAVASWIQRIQEVPTFSDLWVPSASKGSSSSSSASTDTSASSENVTFSSTANLTDKAKSNRADQYKAAP
jgi:Tfp pilus assembly protein PilN